MTIPSALKMLGAFLLLVSITLPMSSCTVTEKPTGEQVSVTPETTKQNDQIEYKYLLEYFDPGDPATWITLIAFGWPALVLSALYWKRNGRIAVAIRILEPILLLGSLAWIEYISTFFADRREIGAYLAFFALGIYAVGIVLSDVAIYRKWKHEGHT